MKEQMSRFWLRASTVATMAACFFVIISFCVFSANMQDMLTLWGEDIQITAYLKSGLGSEQIQKIISTVSEDPRAVHVELVDQKKSLSEFLS